MTPERWLLIDGLLSKVRDLPAGERVGFLEDACGEDLKLQQEVEALLGFDDSHSFIDQPIFEVHGADREIGKRIGPYEILRLLGRGGMGAVYLATRQDDYHQQVALKLVKKGMDSEEIIRRFQNERQILANLEHPNIARLLDGGTTDDGRLFFAMEYIEGEPIDQYCDGRELSIARRLHLFLQVCLAVQFSHQNLVIHRDLKPGNILVTSKEGIPKLLDFGIAKILDPSSGAQTLMTQPGQGPMTLKYASPEQARGERLTTASDIYSLGVLLYQFLTGHHPNRLETLTNPGSNLEVIRRICEMDPQKPSRTEARGGEDRKIQRQLQGDLDSILLKALRKEPEARYASVEQLAADIERHLQGLPVTARKGTFIYHVSKSIRRNRWRLAGAMILLSFGLTTAAVSFHERDQAAKERQQALKERDRADQLMGFLVGIFDSADPDRNPGEIPDARQILKHAREDLGNVLHSDPLHWSKVVDRLGQIYRNLGFYEEAGDVMQESLSVLRQQSPDDHGEVSKRINNLAVFFYDQGNYEQAEEYFREALEMRRRLGQENLETVRNLNNLATILAQRGAFEKAAELYQKGLDLRVKLWGPEHTNVATSYRSLGHLAYLRCDFLAAENYLRDALRIRQQAFGRDNTKVAKVIERLADVLMGQGRYLEAEELHQEALNIRLKRLDEDHLDIARSRASLLELQFIQSQEVSQEQLDWVLEILRRHKPSADWEVARAESLQGVQLLSLQHYREAEPLIIQGYATIRNSRGADAVMTQAALGRVYDLYSASDDQDALDAYPPLVEKCLPPN